MTGTKQIALAGFAATAVAFGPARIGFGLFLPQFRNAFDLSTTLAGIIASTGFISFLLALPLTAMLVRRAGPRLPVLLGAVSAALGFVAIATASGPLQLLIGVLFASASAGLCWAPFNDAAERFVAARSRPGILAVIASGTSIGIVLAAGLSLGVAFNLVTWRAAWFAFAIGAGLTALGVLIEMPRSETEVRRGKLPRLPNFAAHGAAPLYVAAFVFGATNAVYFSFSADHVVNSGGLAGLPANASAAMIFFAYGVYGLLGVMTGAAEARAGIGWLLRSVFAAAGLSHILIAFAPQSWPAVLASAGIQGAALMAVSALISMWSLRLFPGQATTGFVAALMALALGSIAGPAAAGLVADASGAMLMFMLASLPLFIITLWPGRWVSREACN